MPECCDAHTPRHCCRALTLIGFGRAVEQPKEEPPFDFCAVVRFCCMMCFWPGRRRLFFGVVFRRARRRRRRWRSQQGDRLGQVFQLGAPEPDQRHVLRVRDFVRTSSISTACVTRVCRASRQRAHATLTAMATPLRLPWGVVLVRWHPAT